MIADHLGVTGDIAKSGKLAEAVGETAALAKYPNVSVKLSTTPFYSAESYPFRDMTAAYPPPVRRLRSAPLLLGHRSDQFVRTRRPTSSASPISPKRSISSRRRTRNGSWVARSWLGSDGPSAKPMTKILLTRHGHVDGIKPERFRGRAPLDLTARGRADASAVARRIAAAWQPTQNLYQPARPLH